MRDTGSLSTRLAAYEENQKRHEPHTKPKEPRLTWPQADRALRTGEAEEVSDDLGYKYTVSASGDPLVNWGGCWQSPYSVIDLECRSFRISKPRRNKMEEQKPQPMSEADRRALMRALADGKVCLVEYKVIAYTTTIRERFRLTDMGALQHHTDTRGWQCVGSPGFSGQLISWSEVREPRVFEFEGSRANAFPLPPDLRDAINSGARFRIRYEEILP